MHDLAIISASEVYSVTSAPIQDGAIAVGGGRIIGIGGRDEMLRQFPAAIHRAFENALLIPGMVNAHTHLELSYLRRQRHGPMLFTRWVDKLMQSYPRAEDVGPIVANAAAEGMRECLEFGVTSVGDISRQCQFTRPILRNGPLRVVSFGEVAAMGKRRDRLGALLEQAADKQMESPTLQTGVSPHAPYSVEGPALAGIVDRALQDRLPITMHLAELAEEGEFLRDLSGPLGRAWGLMLKIDLLDERIPLMEGGPIAWANTWGLLAAARHVPVVLAHVNYIAGGDLDLLAAAGVSVAYCPRTRHFFGHDAVRPHRYKEMLDRGINVCLGTDSLASNPDLSLLREAQFLILSDPTIAAADVLEMVTIRGARALGLSERLGSLEVGKNADFSVFPSRGGGLQGLFTNAPDPTSVFIGGALVFGVE